MIRTRKRATLLFRRTIENHLENLTTFAEPHHLGGAADRMLHMRTEQLQARSVPFVLLENFVGCTPPSHVVLSDALLSSYQDRRHTCPCVCDGSTSWPDTKTSHPPPSFPRKK
jgi:hypothetical protein